MRRGTLTPANTYTDGSIFFTSDADSEFPHANSKTRESDMAYLLHHGITDTCPSLKIYSNTDELRVNVNGESQNNVKLLMSCHCKLRFTMFTKRCINNLKLTFFLSFSKQILPWLLEL